MCLPPPGSLPPFEPPPLAGALPPLELDSPAWPPVADLPPIADLPPVVAPPVGMPFDLPPVSATPPPLGLPPLDAAMAPPLPPGGAPSSPPEPDEHEATTAAIIQGAATRAAPRFTTLPRPD